MDDVYRTNALIKNQPTRYSFSPHLNHRATPEVEVAMPLWLDHFLKGDPALPETPRSELALKNADGIPSLRVTPAKHAWPVTRCEIYYSVDPDPRARFWRSAEITREGDTFTAKLPLHTLDLPLFAFANVHFTLPEPVSLAQLPGHGKPVSELCLSTLMHRVEPKELSGASIAITAKPTTLLDDFTHGLRDWYVLNAGNPTHQEMWTRKVTDPIYRGANGARLKLTLTMPKTNRITIVLQQNEWRGYRGQRATFVCEREVQSADAAQTLVLEAKDFISPDGALTSWEQIDQLGICAHYSRRGAAAKEVPLWNGPAVTFHHLEWI